MIRGTWLMAALMTVQALAAHGAELGAPSLKVMSFNVRYGLANDGPDAWELRKDKLVATVRHWDPDLMGTQECLDFQAAYIVASLPAYGKLGIGREADGGGEMTAVFYKKAVLRPEESGTFWLSETPEKPGSQAWDAALPRIATWVRFTHIPSGRVFHYFNTHFDHKGVQAREESAKLLAERVAALPSDSMVVVTGDFNSAAETSAPWRFLTEGASLSDSWQKAEAHIGPANTWNGFETPKPGSERRIDWILVRGPVDVRSCETVDWTVSGRYPSDHFPVQSVLVLR